jgi:secreted protein with Ig-like and vWFA domain
VLPDLDSAKKAHEIAKFQFINTELDLAITFAMTAKSSRGATAKFERNLAHASEAHDSAKRFLDSANLSAEMVAQVQVKLARLQHLLAELSRDKKPPVSPPTAGDDESPVKSGS